MSNPENNFPLEQGEPQRDDGVISTDSRERGEPIDVRKLSFAELETLLQEAKELGKMTFLETENGFKCAKGHGVYIEHHSEKYRIASLPDLSEFHRFVFSHPNSPLTDGSENKQELTQAVRQMIEELGGRIIE